MHFKIDCIIGDCEFKQISMQDGLRVAGYAAKIHNGSVDESADAMVKMGDIALKYLTIDGQDVKDVAGLVSMCSDSKHNPMALTAITLKFMENFENFL